MNTHIISMPVSGQTQAVPVAQGAALTFAFDPAAAVFSRDGADLVLDFATGGQVTVADFFAGEALPDIVLSDGSTIGGDDFLRNIDPDMDLATAAGPAGGGNSSGGSGEYADDAGSIPEGVDRLGSLGTDQWTRNTNAPEYVALDVAPGDGVNYVARAVLYMTDGDAAGAARFYLLDANGVPVKAADGELDGNAPSSANGLIDTSTITYNNDGSISLDLSGKGQAALNEALGAANGDRASTGNLFDYITFTYAGREYTVQVVINSSGSYVPADAEADLVSGGAIYGEWHSETQGSGAGNRETGSGHDEVVLEGLYAMHGMALDTGAGNDAVRIEGNVLADASGDNTINTGTGNDTVRITGRVQASANGDNTINTGTGPNDSVTVGRDVTASGGDNTITTEGSLTVGASVWAGNGENVLQAGAVTVGGGVTANSGDNTITAEGSLTVGASVWAGSGKNVLRGDSVTVERTAAFEAGINDIASDGALLVKNGVKASGNGAENILGSGGAMDITGAVQSQSEGKSILTSGGDMDIKGMAQSLSGGNTTLTSRGDITITAADEALAAKNYESMNPTSITATADGTVAITATGGTGGIIEGVRSYRNSTVAVTAGTGITVAATAQGDEVRALAINAEGIGTVTMETALGDITLDASGNKGAVGVYSNDDSKLEATGGDVAITVTGGSGAVGVIGGLDIIAKDKIVIKADADSGNIGNLWNGAEGVVANSKYTANITAAEVAIHAGNTGGDAMAMHTHDRGSILVDASTGSGTVTVDAVAGSGSKAWSMYAEGVRSANTQPPPQTLNKITSAGNVEVTAAVAGDTGDVRGVLSHMGGRNHIYADGEVEITATGGNFGRGVDAWTDRSENIIAGKGGVTIANITGFDAVGVAASYTGTNLISSSDGVVTITAGRSDDSQEDAGWATGLWALDGGRNTITASEVHITAQYGKNATSGVRAEGGSNLIEGFAGQGITVVIEAKTHSAGNAVALWANKGGSVNTIMGSSVAGTASSAGTSDEITLIGGMYAGQGGLNKIETGSGDDNVTISGPITGAGNSINTGSGDDVISLNGAIEPGALTIFAGEGGNDILVLTAPDAGTFRDYYEGWLAGLHEQSADMGIEAVHVHLDDVHGVTAGLGDMAWLGEYLPDPVQVTTGAGDDALTVGSASDLLASLGAGDDMLIVNADAHGNTFDGGAGDDILHLVLGNADAHDQLAEFLGANTVSNFEGFLVDASENGAADVLNLDDLFGSAADMTLFVKAGAEDTLGTGGWSQDTGDTVLIGGTTYTAWTDDDGQMIYLNFING